VAGSSVSGNCGLIHFEEHSFALFAQTRPEASPSVLKAVAQAAVGQTLPMAEMSKKFTRTSGTTYMAFSCPECHAVSGDMYVRNLILEAGYAEPYRSITVQAGARGLHRPHWCVEGNNGFCAQPPPGYQPPLHSGDSENESPATVLSAVNVQLVGQSGMPCAPCLAVGTDLIAVRPPSVDHVANIIGAAAAGSRSFPVALPWPALTDTSRRLLYGSIYPLTGEGARDCGA